MSATFDYKNQAWTENGKYVRCGHPASMNCTCYGRLHAGEPINHTKDSDCDVDVYGSCVLCGVLHGDPCELCGGKGFHTEDCPDSDANIPEPDIDDTVNCCPDCERPNQFGDLCESCTQDEIERMSR